jgi:hypothetical protein
LNADGVSTGDGLDLLLLPSRRTADHASLSDLGALHAALLGTLWVRAHQGGGPGVFQFRGAAGAVTRAALRAGASWAALVWSSTLFCTAR